jgi:DNA-binding transcriptional MerR regulator
MSEINMKVVLRLTGLTPDTLRAWEKRYQVVQPRRTESGRRVYSDQQINRLRLLAELVRGGYSIGKIANWPDPQLVSELANLRAQSGTSQPGISSVAKPVSALVESIRNFDLRKLKTELARVRFVCSPRDFAFHIVPQLMMQVGLKIDQGEFSISQEHATSDLVRYHLRQIYEELEAIEINSADRPSLVFASPEGQYHDLGLLLAATACRYRGANARFLGPNLPAESLAQAAREIRASAVVASLSLIPPEEEKIAPQKWVKELDRLLPPQLEIWLGGGAASTIQRNRMSRDIWIFESLEGLNQKLDSILPPLPY